MTGSLLIVTHFYPPSSMVAARRPAGLAKYLRRLGYRVTVLTSRAWATLRPTGPGWSHGDLMASRMNWRRATCAHGSAARRDYESGPSRLAGRWCRTPRS